MKSPLLPLSLLAVVGAIVSGVLYFRAHQAGQAVQRQLMQSKSQGVALESQVATLTARNTALQTQVSELDASLGEAKTKATVTAARNVQLSREITQLKSQLAGREQDAQTLQREVADLKQELVATRESAASAESVAAYQATIADLEQKLTPASTTPVSVSAPPSAPPTPVLTTNRSRNASVMSVGPSSAFVVINYGATHGALPGQLLRIQRGTEILARVLISDVRETQSIAQVQPDSLRGALHKGDLALLTE
ncbi:MAG: hypothetical protein KA257_05250 [Opitutaceae bacterium]|nr:hypothetical protein [Opitutaceae bacterium]MBP9912922.1 hypothetical protein [Opitutaceae bacterium]